MPWACHTALAGKHAFGKRSTVVSAAGSGGMNFALDL